MSEQRDAQRTEGDILRGKLFKVCISIAGRPLSWKESIGRMEPLLKRLETWRRK